MKSVFIDMLGKQYGCWLVLSRSDDAADGRSTWLVKCVECGKTRAFGGKHLRLKKPPCDSCRMIAERKNPPPHKKCTKCSTVKVISDFGRNIRNRYGVQSWCKACRDLESQRHYKENYLQKKRTNDKWRLKNRNRYEESCRERHLLNTYGITLATYQEMHDAHNGVCAICKRAETKRSKNGKLLWLAVDHCHETGKVRGLLCCTCNSGIGLIGDTKERADATVAYLENAYGKKEIGVYESRQVG